MIQIRISSSPRWQKLKRNLDHEGNESGEEMGGDGDNDDGDDDNFDDEYRCYHYHYHRRHRYHQHTLHSVN